MIEQLSLRRAVAADASAVLALTRMAYAKWVPLIGREPKPMTADYERAVAEHIIDLWEEGGELLALIEMIPEADCLWSRTLRLAGPAGQGYRRQTPAPCRTPRALPGFRQRPALHQRGVAIEPSILRPSRLSGVSAGDSRTSQRGRSHAEVDLTTISITTAMGMGQE